MASSKHTVSYDDSCVDDCENDCEDECVYFYDDDSGEDEDEHTKQTEIELTPEETYLKRMTHLNAQYEKPLEACGEALKGKLSWASAYVAPTSSKTIDDLLKQKSAPLNPTVATAKKVATKTHKFKGRGAPLPIAVNFRQGESAMAFKEPEPVVVSRPDGRPVLSKKIWMCKNVMREGKCRFNDRCVYAHNEDEIQKEVRPCQAGNGCRLVKRVRGEYINIDGNRNGAPRKCVRLHLHETIKNFVNRTSN